MVQRTSIFFLPKILKNKFVQHQLNAKFTYSVNYNSSGRAQTNTCWWACHKISLIMKAVMRKVVATETYQSVIFLLSLQEQGHHEKFLLGLVDFFECFLGVLMYFGRTNERRRLLSEF